MSSRSVMDFLQAIDELNDHDHLFYKIKYYAAPTIAGIKPSSLLAFTKLKRNSYALWERHKDEICSRLGVHYYELKRREDRLFILLYKSEALTKYLSESKNGEFLQGLGYNRTMALEDLLITLKKRYEKSCPHELGIFLGYPLEDVITFIENEGGPCLASKYWKVYKDVDKALQIFNAYDEEREKVIESVIRLHQKQQRSICCEA